MSSPPPDERETYIPLANWLFGRLALIFVGTAVFTWAGVPAGPSGLFGFSSYVLVSLVALYLTVHVVFSALNDLLEAKLDEKLEVLEDSRA